MASQRNSLLDEIVGVNEIAEILKVRPNVVSLWVHRKQMPEPSKVINKGRTGLWLKSEVLGWASDTGRLPMGVEFNWTPPTHTPKGT